MFLFGFLYFLWWTVGGITNQHYHYSIHSIFIYFSKSRDHFDNALTHGYHRYQNSLIAIHSPLHYFDCFLRDNNSVVFLGSVLGIVVFPKAQNYALPYLVGFLYHQVVRVFSGVWLIFFSWDPKKIDLFILCFHFFRFIVV